MANDKLFNKRKKAKREEQLRKKRSKSREMNPRILIICEGEKTETNYFKGLRNELKLASTVIEVKDGEYGCTPDKLYDYGEDLYKASVKADNRYDKVFCVFDKDTHEHYFSTIEKIDNRKEKNIFYHIESVPCFEYWVLLHYCTSTKPYRNTDNGGKRAVQQVIRDIKEHYPEYEKNSETVFEDLLDKLPTACTNAKIAKESARKHNTDNPLTVVYELVEYLHKIAKKEL